MTNKKSRALSIAVLTIFSIVVVLGCVFAFVSLDDGQLGIRNYVAYPKLIKLGLDLSGGAYAEYTAEQPEDMTDEEFNAAIEGTRRSLEDLLFGKGYTEAQVSSYGNTIRVEVPDIDDPERIFDLVGRPSSLEFKEYTSEDTVNETLMTGEEIANAGVVYNNGSYLVALEFTSEGAEKFADITADLVGKQLGIYVNGELLMAPNVNETISGGTCTIEGDFTYDEAYDLAVQIQAGSFPLDLKPVAVPILGADGNHVGTGDDSILARHAQTALQASLAAALVDDLRVDELEDPILAGVHHHHAAQYAHLGRRQSHAAGVQQRFHHVVQKQMEAGIKLGDRTAHLGEDAVAHGYDVSECHGNPSIRKN